MIKEKKEASELDKKQEEELRAKVIEYLSVISEHWDEGITQSLMISPYNYDYASELCLEGLELWIKALKLLEKLKKGSE